MDSMFENATMFNNNSVPMNWNCSSLTSATKFGLNSGLYGTGPNAKYDINPGNAIRIGGLSTIETPKINLTNSDTSLKYGTFIFSISKKSYDLIAKPSTNKIPIINNSGSFRLTITPTSSPFDDGNKVTFTINFQYRLMIGSDGLSFAYDIGYYKNYTITIQQFGNIPLSNNGSQFSNLFRLGIIATDAPNILPNTSLSNAFNNYNNFTNYPSSLINWNVPSINGWNVSNVTNMSYMFNGCSIFNQDINSWDVSKVTNMSYMFNGCSSFNQNINSWDVSKVTNMSYMFNGCSSFNKDINSWTVSSVTDMSYMFNGCSNFNSIINSWNVSKVTNMKYMFNGCSSFNQDINSWIVSNVTDMKYMFNGCSIFNSKMNNWNVSNVICMSNMFNNALAFNNSKTQMNWSLNSAIYANGFGDYFGTNSGLYPEGKYYINPGYGTSSNKKAIQTSPNIQSMPNDVAKSYYVGTFEYNFVTINSTFDETIHIPIINNSGSFIYIETQRSTNGNITIVTIKFYYVRMMDNDGLSFNTDAIKKYYGQTLITITKFGYIPLSKDNYYNFQDATDLKIQISNKIIDYPYIHSNTYNDINLTGKKMYYIEYTNPNTVDISYNIYMPYFYGKFEIYSVTAGGSGGAGGGDQGKGKEGTNGAGGGGGVFDYKKVTIGVIDGGTRYATIDSSNGFKFSSDAYFKLIVGAGGASVNGGVNNNGNNGKNGNNTKLSLDSNIYNKDILNSPGGGGGGGGHPTSNATPGNGASFVGSIGNGETSSGMNGGKSGYSLDQLKTNPKFKSNNTYPYGNGGSGTEGKAAPNNNPTGSGYNGYARIYYII
jgi:surface protein